MKKIKKIILLSTGIPLLGKLINKPIVLYRRFLDLIGEVYTIRCELNELRDLKERVSSLENNAEHINIVKSVPVGFRKFSNQITELSQKISIIENQLESSNLEKYLNSKT